MAGLDPEMKAEVIAASDDAAEERSSDPATAPASGVADADEASVERATAQPEQPVSKAPDLAFYRDMDEGIALLPPYSKSLLKVKVPVTVTLAATTQPINRILELCPGSVLQFDKTCDDTLTLKVSGQPVAIGEPVKVGDKFGLWITAMAMPEERFWVVNGKNEHVRVK
ncbi:MAG: FliM/FliN family flagellar motor C-terminal domain-containing protein [Pirellulaceae bacterium]